MEKYWRRGVTTRKDRYEIDNEYTFCPECGQTMDWSDRKMSKGILIVNIPKSCGKCTFVDDYGYCRYLGDNIDLKNLDVRNAKCPLVPMPESLIEEIGGWRDFKK